MATALLGAPELDLEARIAALPPIERQRIDEALLGTGVLTFREFVDRVKPSFRWYRHQQLIGRVLQQVADGERKRVIILAPPRTGKSEPVSRLFTAYWLYRNPEQWVGLTSYSAALATTLSRSARANYVGIGRTLAEDSAAATHWETGFGGGMWAAGFGGSMLGKGMHLGVVDDPIKNAEEANSQVIADRNKDFWVSTFTSRLEPNGAIVVVLQRWPGAADLVAQLFEMEQGEEPEGWHVVCLEGEKEERPLNAPPAKNADGTESASTSFPASCTLEPDWRKPGEPLCPERLSPQRMRQMRERSPYFFAAQVQQRPEPRGDVMFPRELARVVDAAPVEVRRLRYWDKAGTEGGGKFTAGVRMAIDSDGLVYVEDVVRAQHEALRRRKLMRVTAELDGVTVEHVIEQEPGSSGKDSAGDDVRNLAGFTASYRPASGDKFLRADPFASQWQAGNVRLVRGTWNKAYLDEMELARPGAAFLDQMDASSGAYNELAGTGGLWVL